MQIDQTRHGAVTVIRPQGPLIDQDARVLMTRLREVLAESLGRFVLDLSAVPFLDSVGLETLVDAGDELAHSGLAFKLCAVNETISQVFNLTGCFGQFEQYEDVNSAVRSFL
ncbi:MAG: STAS domain-containing protein [Phycisphaeraceae bacterium]|nr:STAS domain-containing protein [Phycisphaeraceae bacterium]MCW5754829.1 STAS domain-containing protein [Phycisphaeraceae bacterium]